MFPASLIFNLAMKRKRNGLINDKHSQIERHIFISLMCKYSLTHPECVKINTKRVEKIFISPQVC